MAVNFFTTDSLIEHIKRKASIPDSQDLFTDEDLLAFINEELQIGIVPTILSEQEEYLVYEVEVDLAASTSNYEIPYRAVGGKLRDIFYKDEQGNLKEMTRISPDDKSYFQASNVQNLFEAYYIQGNDVILTPAVGTGPTGSLLMTIYLRPNAMVAEDKAAIITAINVVSTTTVYTVDVVPYSSGTTYMATTDYVDIVQARPGFRTRKYDLSPTAIDSTLKTITFTTTDLPSGVVVGDYINFACEAIVPQIPADLHNILAQRAVARCLEAMGDAAGLQAANLKLAEMENKSSALINNRVDGAPLKITNIRGILRRGRGRF